MIQLYDYAGRPVKPPSRPETREIAAVSLRDRWSNYPSRGLTPGRLAQIFTAADAGDLYSQAELFQEMEEKDPHLMSVMQTRRLAVLGVEWQVEDASEDAQDKKIATFVREQLEALKLKSLFAHLLGAIGHGYATAEPKWSTGGSPWTIGGFNLIFPKNITFVNSLVPLVITEDNSAGVEPRPFQLIYHRGAAKSGHDTRNGVLRVCAYMYLFKNYALKDWAAFNEIFGMPLRLGKYQPSATPADRDALRLAIGSLGTDAAGIISESTEIEFVEAASRLSGTTNPYEVMAYFCNREISKAVLGQTLTTDTQGSTGTYAAGQVQNEVRQDLLEADAEMLSETIREQIIRPLVGFNFGWDVAEKATPGFDLLIQDSPDLKADSEVLKNLAGVPGAAERIPASYINEHFGIPEPKKGEATLGTAPPEPPPGQGKGTAGGDVRPTGMRAVLSLRDSGGLVLIPQDQEAVNRIQALDDLAAQAAAAADTEIMRMLAPVKELIAGGQSLEEIKGELLKLYSQIEVEGLVTLIHEARMRAFMKGRLTE